MSGVGDEEARAQAAARRRLEREMRDLHDERAATRIQSCWRGADARWDKDDGWRRECEGRGLSVSCGLVVVPLGGSTPLPISALRHSARTEATAGGGGAGGVGGGGENFGGSPGVFSSPGGACTPVGGLAGISSACMAREAEGQSAERSASSRSLIFNSVARQVETKQADLQATTVYGDPLLEQGARIVRLTGLHVPSITAAVDRIRTLRTEAHQLHVWRGVTRIAMQRMERQIEASEREVKALARSSTRAVGESKQRAEALSSVSTQRDINLARQRKAERRRADIKQRAADVALDGLRAKRVALLHFEALLRQLAVLSADERRKLLRHILMKAISNHVVAEQERMIPGIMAMRIQSQFRKSQATKLYDNMRVQRDLAEDRTKATRLILRVSIRSGLTRTPHSTAHLLLSFSSPPPPL